jgi:hypothetical protein
MASKISFIVTARNEAPQMLAATVDSVLTTSAGHHRELVIIDDGSETPLQHESDSVTVIRNPVPIGVAQSRRKGAAIATGDILVWLDAHMTFAPGWLDLMLEHVDSGSLLCSAYWDYHRSTCYSWGADLTWCAERSYRYGRSPGFALRYRRRFFGHGALPVPVAVGACYMLLRSSYNTLGGFCPLFRVWGVDEQDISARAWLTGLGVKCVVGSVVGHLCRPTFPYPVQYDHVEFNQLVMLRTVFEPATVHALERFFQPVSAQVESWLAETALDSWRAAVQSRRQYGDWEFFKRFVPAFLWGFPSSRLQTPV